MSQKSSQTVCQACRTATRLNFVLWAIGWFTWSMTVVLLSSFLPSEKENDQKPTKRQKTEFKGGAENQYGFLQRLLLNRFLETASLIDFCHRFFSDTSSRFSEVFFLRSIENGAA